MSRVGVVVIGRDEGERLRGCLESLTGHGLTLIYVDSGSQDESVALAHALGVEVVALDLSIPFSAARARNTGFERLSRRDSTIAYVMFVDGDCEVVAGWIERAVAELDARPDAAVVCGRRREKFPSDSVYNRLADLEWDTPVGEATACGGDAMMRASAFQQVGGFDPTVPAGEEPELCQRFRAAGWRIFRIDAEMTRHDLAMTRFRQWWRRAFRTGYGGLDVATRFRGPERLFQGLIRSARIWAVGWPVAMVVVGLVGGGWGGWKVGVALSSLVALALPAQVLRLALKIQPRVRDIRTALAYGTLTMIAKLVSFVGQCAYLRDRATGRTARLVEYKGSGITPAARA